MAPPWYCAATSRSISFWSCCSAFSAGAAPPRRARLVLGQPGISGLMLGEEPLRLRLERGQPVAGGGKLGELGVEDRPLGVGRGPHRFRLFAGRDDRRVEGGQDLLVGDGILADGVFPL